MKKIDIDRLPLLDLRGHAVALRNHFQDFLLLVFLRHLA